jgi:hypothetical protein
MPLLNYTTTIDPHRTVGEIQKLLAGKGARGILTEYADGEPVAVAFQIEHSGQVLRYRLPCRAAAVHNILLHEYRAGKVQKRFAEKSHAQRVAWRIVKDWIEAQLALVESGMTDMAEVFMPYQLVEGDVTMYEVMQQRLLAGPLGGGE